MIKAAAEKVTADAEASIVDAIAMRSCADCYFLGSCVRACGMVV